MVGQEPPRGCSLASRQFYIPERMPNHGERCSSCSVSADCEFYYDITKGVAKTLYKDNEAYDGYIRDRCIFSEKVDIEDTMSVLVRYPEGIQLTYGLTAATPFEGWQVSFNGSKGRLEAFEPETYLDEEDQRNLEVRKSTRHSVDWRTAKSGHNEEETSFQIRFYPLFGGVQTFDVPISATEGDHGGGDLLLKEHLFRPGSPDPLGHTANARAGAMSILVGARAMYPLSKTDLYDWMNC